MSWCDVDGNAGVGSVGGVVAVSAYMGGTRGSGVLSGAGDVLEMSVVRGVTVTATDIKTNMRHIHTSIVSRHLATRGNNKILRTPPPHNSSSEEILPRLTRRTLAQLRSNKSPFLKSYFHKVDAKTHPSPVCPSVTSTHTTHIISSTVPTYAPHCRPWICGQTPPE